MPGLLHKRNPVHKLQKMMSNNKLKQDDQLSEEEGQRCATLYNLGDCTASKTQQPPAVEREGADRRTSPAGSLASEHSSFGHVDPDGLLSQGPPPQLAGEVLFKGPSASKYMPYFCMLEDGELSYRKVGKRTDNLVLAVSDLEAISVVAPLTIVVALRGGSGRNSIGFRLQNADELFMWSSNLQHHIAHAHAYEGHGSSDTIANGIVNGSANSSSSSFSHGTGGTGSSGGTGGDGDVGDEDLRRDGVNAQARQDEASSCTGEALLGSDSRFADTPPSSLLPKKRLSAEGKEPVVSCSGQETASSRVGFEGEPARDTAVGVSRSSPVGFGEERHDHEIAQRRATHDLQLRWLLDEEIRCELGVRSTDSQARIIERLPRHRY